MKIKSLQLLQTQNNFNYEFILENMSDYYYLKKIDYFT